jgi:hypothetical protein
LAYSACTKTGNSLQSGSTQDGDTLLNGSVGNGDVALLDDETQLANSAYDLTKSLPLNYVEDASVDYTNYIQKGMSANLIAKMPNFRILINENGLKMLSGARLFFQEKSVIVLKGNSLSSYAVIGINNVNDIIMYYPRIEGDRYIHTGSSGEWGMGITISGSKNIHIKNPNISKCWGDGIYVGGGNIPNEDVEIYKGQINDCRRNGISITNVKNLQIQGTTISNANGVPPMCGIDIEPNSNNNIIEGVVISDVNTFNNGDGGILIYLTALIGPLEKTVGIEINRHFDNGSNYNFVLGSYYVKNTTDKPLLGSIIINSPRWTNSIKKPVNAPSVYKKMPKTIFNNITVINNSYTSQDVKNILISQENISVF